MLGLTGFGEIFRLIGFLYWALAFVVFVTVIQKNKEKWKKFIFGGIVIAIFGFIPIKAFLEQLHRDYVTKKAITYFRKLCEEKSGEKIYEPQSGVKSVFIDKMLPDPGPGDENNQFWYGDPYSASPQSKRGENAALMFARRNAPVAAGLSDEGLDFIEIRSSNSDLIYKYSYRNNDENVNVHLVDKPASRFGITWEDISTPEDRHYWVAGSRLRVIDLTNNKTVAERIGFLIDPQLGSTSGARQIWAHARFSGTHTGCPSVHDYSDRFFVLKALNPPPQEIEQISIPILPGHVGNQGYKLNARISLARERVYDFIEPTGDAYPEGVKVAPLRLSNGHASDLQLSIRQGPKLYRIQQGFNPAVQDIAVFKDGDETIAIFANIVPYKEKDPLIVIRKFDATGKMKDELLAKYPASLRGSELVSLGEAKIERLGDDYLVSVGRIASVKGRNQYSVAQLRITKLH